MGKFKLEGLLGIFFLGLCLIFMAGCAGLKSKITAPYSYADGNGNIYSVTGDMGSRILEYTPVESSLSSTGFYSGGDYLKKEISELHYDKITSGINNAVGNKSVHIENRVKGSGLIMIQKNGEEATYILEPGSEDLLAIEEALREAVEAAGQPSGETDVVTVAGELQLTKGDVPYVGGVFITGLDSQVLADAGIYEGMTVEVVGVAALVDSNCPEEAEEGLYSQCYEGQRTEMWRVDSITIIE